MQGKLKVIKSNASKVNGIKCNARINECNGM